ncbi:MAG: hypothetical protein LAO78_09105 [Acidobacteriia bacterium]|nr:hypothetical protein [Terriglobia bacterium]
MKNLLVIAVMLLFGLATLAQDGKDKKQDRKDHSPAAKSSDKQHDNEQAERDEHGRKHMKFTQEGEFASVSTALGFDASINLNVSRGSSSTSPTATFINFIFFQFSSDHSVETITQIFGEIPNSAFTGTNTKSLVLDLDTSTLDPATSSSTTCTLDVITFTITCGPGTLGTIHLAFSENGIQATRILNLVEEDIAGPVTTLIHRKSDNGTADVQGFVFGMPVSSSAASVGVNFSSSVEITRH